MTKPTRKLRKLSFVVLAGLGVTVALADAARAAPAQRPGAAKRREWARNCLDRIYRGCNVDRRDPPAHFVAPRAAAA